MTTRKRIALDTDCSCSKAHGPISNSCEIRLTVRVCQDFAKRMFMGGHHVILALDPPPPEKP